MSTSAHRPTMSHHLRRVRAYFAGSRVLGLRLVVLALAVIVANLGAEIIVPRLLVRDGQQALSLLGGTLAIIRIDDLRPASAVNPFLAFTWPLFLVLVTGVLLPLATRLRGYGRAMVAGLALAAGGSLANLVTTLASGVVHNWLAFALPGHSIASYSIGDLGQLVGGAILIAVAGTYALDIFWLRPWATRSRPG
jgi:hypothetical protein